MSKEIREILLDVRTHLEAQKAMGNFYLPREGKKATKMTNDITTTEKREKRSADEKKALLQALVKEMGNCTRCKLSKKRTNIVFGKGNPNAQLMFVGEGPGSEEDKQGLPFVGRAGQLLTKIIGSIELKREDAFICNVLKCRPPENRNPEPDEIEACRPFLFRQIEIIEPKIIVCLGTFAAQLLLDTQEKISRLRGKVFDFRGTRLIPTYHPAFLLRNSEMKRPVWEDMKMVKKLLQGSRTL